MKEKSDLLSNCIRCGRKLKTLESQKLGFGPTCYEKWQKEQSKRNTRLRKLF